MEQIERGCNFRSGQDEIKREKDYAIDSEEDGVGGRFGGVCGDDGVLEHFLRSDGGTAGGR